jgi:hypothetical protein
MWPDPSDEITKELERDERVLWTGMPKQGLMLRGSDAFMIPFSLMWGGFAITWEVLAIMSGAPFFFALFGIPFVVIGIYILFGRFFVDARRRAHTFYGLTDQRVIIVSGIWSRSVKSLNLRMLTDVSLVEKADHKGTITFGSDPPMASIYRSMPMPGQVVHPAPCFEMIENAKEVYRQIRDAQKKS